LGNEIIFLILAWPGKGKGEKKDRGKGGNGEAETKENGWGEVGKWGNGARAKGKVNSYQ